MFIGHLRFAGGSDSKESACSAGDPGSIPGWNIPWGREWQPSPVFLPENFRGSLVGYSLWGHKESDMIGHVDILFCVACFQVFVNF